MLLNLYSFWDSVAVTDILLSDKEHSVNFPLNLMCSWFQRLMRFRWAYSVLIVWIVLGLQCLICGYLSRKVHPEKLSYSFFFCFIFHTWFTSAPSHCFVNESLLDFLRVLLYSIIYTCQIFFPPGYIPVCFLADHETMFVIHRDIFLVFLEAPLLFV